MNRIVVVCMLMSLVITTRGETSLEGAPSTGVSFKEGTGIFLSEATRDALGLTMANVEEKRLSISHGCTAQIYKEATEPARLTGEREGYSYASVLLDDAVAATLDEGDMVQLPASAGTGGVFRVLQRSTATTSSQAEVLIELPDPEGEWKMGRFVKISWIQESTALTTLLPASAVLQTAFGTYAYVQNGEALLRIPIVIGPRHGTEVEVRDGLYDGDEVVRESVQSLYLVELQSSKGGVGCCR